MNRYLSWTCWALIGLLFLGYGVFPARAAEPPSGAQSVSGKTIGADSQTGYLEDILFEKSAGRERVVLVLSRQAGAQIETKNGTSLQVRIPNTFVPEELRKPMGRGALANVLQALPAQQMEQGKPVLLIAIDLQQRRPYLVKQEGNNIVIDFHMGAQAAGEGERVAAATGAAGKQVTAAAANHQGGKQEETKAAATTTPAKDAVAVGPKYTGQKISIDFQDAELRAVLRLLGEQAGKSIVTSPEVKGTITISMQQVPWDQVLETILDLHGLTKKEEGNVITVLSLDKASKDEDAKLKAVEARKKAEEAAKKAANEADLQKGKLRQLMIEAKILEVNEGFTRTLGVQWGGGIQANLGNSDYSMGMLGGTGTVTTPITKLTTGLALTRDSLAMSLGTTMAPTLGIILGGSNAILQARINAMELNNNGRVLSSPRVLTQDTQKAVIEQGEEIPVVTPASANNPATTTYKPATLKLEVTPEIKEDNHILLTIKAKKDSPVKAEKDANTGNMPVSTNSVDSKVVVMDGDTIVIGGVLKTEDAKTVGGVPWLSKIPILGWLFKYEYIEKTKKELLIFITPRIIKADKASYTRM